MVMRKEFYFIRHGQTDHNISSLNLKVDHSADISLNNTGRNQARNVESLISSLPIQAVCSSPLQRVLETKDLITVNLLATHYVIEDLGECSAEIWREMRRLALNPSLPEESVVWSFLDKVKRGINQALLLPGSTLIVAHGGVHFALCHLMKIEGHEWIIDNCIPVHFFLDDTGKWAAKKLV